MPETRRQITDERTFAAPAEAIFDAWTSAEGLRRWWPAGPGWDTPVAEVDVRVGGRLRLVMRAPDGGELGGEGGTSRSTARAGWPSPGGGTARGWTPALSWRRSASRRTRTRPRRSFWGSVPAEKHAEAGMRPLVVAGDVGADLGSGLVDGFPLGAPGAAFLELAEPGLDERGHRPRSRRRGRIRRHYALQRPASVAGCSGVAAELNGAVAGGAGALGSIGPGLVDLRRPQRRPRHPPSPIPPLRAKIMKCLRWPSTPPPLPAVAFRDATELHEGGERCRDDGRRLTATGH